MDDPLAAEMRAAESERILAAIEADVGTGEYDDGDNLEMDLDEDMDMHVDADGNAEISNSLMQLDGESELYASDSAIMQHG